MGGQGQRIAKPTCATDLARKHIDLEALACLHQTFAPVGGSRGRDCDREATFPHHQTIGDQMHLNRGKFARGQNKGGGHQINRTSGLRAGRKLDIQGDIAAVQYPQPQVGRLTRKNCPRVRIRGDELQGMDLIQLGLDSHPAMNPGILLTHHLIAEVMQATQRVGSGHHGYQPEGPSPNIQRKGRGGENNAPTERKIERLGHRVG
jgi:hypothetical protein